jgi:hypothetical protein
MKGVKMNLETVNCVLLVVILALVIYCVVKQNEGFAPNPNNIGKPRYAVPMGGGGNPRRKGKQQSVPMGGGGNPRNAGGFELADEADGGYSSFLRPQSMDAGCNNIAKVLGLPFSTKEKANGAPAGCIQYNDGRVIYVKTCENHPNCGTTNCNGCKVLNV